MVGLIAATIGTEEATTLQSEQENERDNRTDVRTRRQTKRARHVQLRNHTYAAENSIHCADKIRSSSIAVEIIT